MEVSHGHIKTGRKAESQCLGGGNVDGFYFLCLSDLSKFSEW